jgi:hypothetical protein
MLTLLILVLAYGGVRALVRHATRGLPRSNDDMIFY